MHNRIELRCSCGKGDGLFANGQIVHQGSPIFFDAIKDVFREDHRGRGHQVTVEVLEVFKSKSRPLKVT